MWTSSSGPSLFLHPGTAPDFATLFPKLFTSLGPTRLGGVSQRTFPWLLGSRPNAEPWLIPIVLGYS